MNLIPIGKVVELTGFTVATVNTYRYKDGGTFPKPVEVVNKVAHWDKKEIDVWVEGYSLKRKNARVIVSEKAVEMFDDGKTPLQIARFFNTTEKRVLERFLRLGVDPAINQKIIPLYGRECVNPNFKSKVYDFTIKTIARVSK